MTQGEVYKVLQETKEWMSSEQVAEILNTRRAAVMRCLSRLLVGRFVHFDRKLIAKDDGRHWVNFYKVNEDD
jgi:predicted transcriptional regulator